MVRIAIPAFILLSGLTATPASVRAAESYDNCTGFIDTVPATITTQGTWCLRQELSTAMVSGDAITIATNNVTIDCNDFKLGGLAAGLATQARGIYADTRLNATVRHCHIRGFQYGVLLQGVGGGSVGSSGHVVEDNRFDSNTGYGLKVAGDGAVVQHNLILNTGHSTSSLGVAYGIYTYGAVDVLNNIVSGVLPGGISGNAYGIWTQNNTSGSISGNRVRLVAPGSVLAVGINNSQNGRISIDGNHVIGDGSPGSGSGLICFDDNARAWDNIINGFDTPITNCRNEGNNSL